MSRLKVQRWVLLGVCIMLLTLGGLLLPGMQPAGAPGFTERIEAGLFSLEMTAMNETRQTAFQMQGSDAIEVSVVHRSGELMIAITDSAGSTVYEGRNPDLESFRVNVRESGDCTVSVTGKRAEGSVSFRKMNREE